MTVPVQERKAGPFAGDDANTAFPFDFKIFAKTDVSFITADADGVETVQVLDSDFSVVVNPDQDNNPGGEITYPILGDPLAAGESAVILGALAASQGTDIPNLSGFLPQVIEDRFDYITILIQQLLEEISRAVKVSATSGEDPDALIASLLQAAATASSAAATAVAAAVSAAGSFASFDARYLGAKAADPVLDNQGDPLIEGALYWNSVANEFRVWDGDSWETFGGGGGGGTVTGAENLTAGVGPPAEQGFFSSLIAGILKFKTLTTISEGLTLNADLDPNTIAIGLDLAQGTEVDTDPEYYTRVVTPATVGAFAAAGTAGRLLNVQAFPASGTWTKPVGFGFGIAILVGAGGGGGQANGNGRGGGGGGSGSLSMHRFEDADVDATEAVAIGNGGDGGGGGPNGSTTTFGGTIATAPGGSGGTDGNTSPVQGGPGGSQSGTGNIATFQGSYGQPGLYDTTNGGVGGTGGSSHFGGGGRGGIIDQNGVNAIGKGSGGGGAASGGTLRDGGDGANGFCIVYSYSA